jgi:O-antigen/teichoic acid export membrane protein
VAGYLYGAVAASIYYTTQMPAFFLSQLVNKLTDNSGPAINELYARGITESLRRAFLRLHRYNWILAIAVGLGFFFLGKPMITLWVGPAQFGGDWMVVALALFVVIFSIVNINKTLIIASGQIGILSIFALVEGVVNLVLSLILGHYLGLAGIIWATLIANIPTSVYLLRRSQHLLKLTIEEYSREVLKPLLIPLGMGIGTFLILNKTIIINAWGPFFLIAFLFLLIYSVLSYWLSIDTAERLLLNNMLLGFFRGINPLKVAR